MPSPRNARPRYGSRLRPVIAPIALMCPRFSATSTIATGAISTIAFGSNTGAAKFGRPIHAAASILESRSAARRRPVFWPAARHGATKKEIAEAFGVTVDVNASAALVYSARVIDAFDEYPSWLSARSRCAAGAHDA